MRSWTNALIATLTGLKSKPKTAKGNDKMRDDYDDNSEMEVEEVEVEKSDKKQKKRGYRKSAAEKAEEAKLEESMQIYDVEFDNRHGMESDIDAFRITCVQVYFLW